MKKGFNFFIYISIVFFILTLIQIEYLKIPKIYNPTFLFFSFMLLATGFIFNAVSWIKVIKPKYHIKYNQGLASIGLSIFGKYIPGKVWGILGRAEYLALKTNYPRKDLSSLSFNTQFISLWTGLLFGTIGIIAINAINVYGLSVLLLFFILTLIIYTSLFHNLVEIMLSKIYKKQVEIPKLAFIKVLKISPWFLLTWGFWCISFFLFAASLISYEISFNIAWGFALAASLGILTVIAPGGIGVREGLLTGYLTLTGMNFHDATTIAITSRMWFLVGEIFIFLVGYILDKFFVKVYTDE